MTERRKSSRLKSFLQGRIYFNNRRSSLDCLVRDFSELGAKLKISESVVIPEVLELHIPNKDEVYRARVQWRVGEDVGVAFGDEKPSPSIVPSAAPDLLNRVRKLETEMAALQRKVNELQADLRSRQGSGI